MRPGGRALAIYLSTLAAVIGVVLLAQLLAHHIH